MEKVELKTEKRKALKISVERNEKNPNNPITFTVYLVCYYTSKIMIDDKVIYEYREEIAEPLFNTNEIAKMKDPLEHFDQAEEELERAVKEYEDHDEKIAAVLRIAIGKFRNIEYEVEITENYHPEDQ